MPCIKPIHQPSNPPPWPPAEKKLKTTTWLIAFQSCFRPTRTKRPPPEKEVRQLGVTVRFSYEDDLVQDKEISKIGQFFKKFFGR
jgi:hypothetical protein